MNLHSLSLIVNSLLLGSSTHRHTRWLRSSLWGLQLFLAAASYFCDTFSGVLMLARHLTANRLTNCCQETVMDGWTVTEVAEGGGDGVRKDEGRCCYGGGGVHPDPMAASPLRWMKAPWPSVVAVTNLLRFSARLEARGRLPPPPPPTPPDHQLSLNTQCFHLCPPDSVVWIDHSRGYEYFFITLNTRRVY